jgi:cyclophilin family peptidyl-prolyl cis-trans isomerase
MKRLLFVALALTLAAGCAADPVTTAKDKVGGKKKKAPSGENNPVVVMKTSMGTIKVELFPEDAPGTVKNFLHYVDKKFYDGTVFHRVMSDFMIQGGGFEKGVSRATNEEEFKAKEKTTDGTIKNEADNGLSNERGTIAMARLPQPHTASAQFFINVVDNPKLDHRGTAPPLFGYCVFGKVVEGMDVVDKIKEVETKRLFPGVANVPVQDVVIESVRRADKADKKK